MALDKDKTLELRAWLARDAGGVAWVTGSAGSGMTTMVRGAVAGMEAVWMTPATLKTRSFIRDLCTNRTAVNGKRKVIVLDELDVVLSVETVMQDVAHMLRLSGRVPVVCVLKSTRAALSCPLRRKAALVLDFPPPTFEATVEVVTRVARDEGLDCERIPGLCRLTPGDIRHVLQTLRACSDSVRDVNLPTTDAVAAVLGRDVSVLEALGLYEQDAGGVPSGVFEVYWRGAREVHDCCAFLDMASLADVVDRCIHARQRWDLMPYHGALSVCSAAVALPRMPGVVLDKFGTLWNKSNMLCTRLKQAKNVQRQRSLQTMLKIEELAYIRRMIGDSLSDVRRAADVCRRAGLNASACLDLMRLWKTGYKLGVHAKMKVHLKT